MEHDARLLARFASVLASLDADLEPAYRLCESARLVLGADGASVVLRLLNGRLNLLGATSASTRAFDHGQQLAGEGPALDAVATGGPVFVGIDPDGLARWTTLDLVAERDIVRGNYWAVPMRPADVVVGVLSLHRESGQLREQTDAVQFVADAVGTVLIRGDHPFDDPAPQDTGAWSERAEVHQATGMIIAQLRLHPDDAITLLRAHAFAQGRDVYAVALDVVAGVISFNDEDGGIA